MEESSLEKLMNNRKERKPSCTLCRNHGVRSKSKGHKLVCPFSNCDCEPCVKGRQRRVVMREQVRLRRRQMKDIGGRSYCVTPFELRKANFSPTFVKTESPPTKEHSSLDGKEAASKHNGGLIQSVSNILHSQLGVPRQHHINCSAYMPTPFQLQWTPGDVYSGFHYNNWRTEQPVSSCSIEPPTSPGFTVSDNSAFVKYCNHSPRMESNSFRFDRSSSADAAAVLASFGNPEQISKH
ncbi:hypothetical protein ACROYT_G011395 [Oculina patagonica]